METFIDAKLNEKQKDSVESLIYFAVNVLVFINETIVCFCFRQNLYGDSKAMATFILVLVHLWFSDFSDVHLVQ